MSQPETRDQQICTLALRLVDQGRQMDADLGVLFNALAMAYLTTVIASRTAEGQDVEEADIAEAIKEFNGALVQQSQFLLNFHPQLLKSENSTSQESE